MTAVGCRVRGAGCGRGIGSKYDLEDEVLRFGRAHEDTLARAGVSRKSKLIRIKGLAGRCCCGGCCRPTEEEETRGERVAARKSHVARGTEGIQARGKSSRTGEGKGMKVQR